jgi:hypothetical protein
LQNTCNLYSQVNSYGKAETLDELQANLCEVIEMLMNSG